MKTVYRVLPFLMSLMFLVTSCNKDEIVDNNIASLGFSSFINDFIEGGRLPDDLPECSDDIPFTICVKIKDENGNWVLDNTPLFDNDGLGAGDDNIIEVNIAPTSGVDTDNDGDNDSWFTEESESLKLLEGAYSIEYFVVKKESGSSILAAPHENATFGNVEYQNFVSDALPIELTLFAGTKKYVDVEVLCFEPHYAVEFGYLFNDIIEIEQQHVCFFGNVCDNAGLHHPAHFDVKIWEYDAGSADLKGDLLFDGPNEYGINSSGDEYALPLCIPLPDREEIIEEFFGEIWLIDDGVYSLIREGVFNENQIKALYINSDTSYYWHFRENCEQCDDEPILLDGCVSIPPNACNGFRTQTQGGWGAPPNGNNPGIYLTNNFANAFPNGLKIGCNTGLTLELTSAQAITDLLPEGGSPAVLSQNYQDPTNVGNVLVGQIIALTLSVGFDNYDSNFGLSSVQLEDLKVSTGDFIGFSVEQILDEANKVIGGCTASYSPQEINTVVSIINANYTDGTTDNGFLICD